MNDPYVYENSNILRNLLNISDQKALEIAEAEISSANMMLLYEKGFTDFSSKGIKTIHKVLFGDVYDWAGELRVMNVMKRENVLAGKSVWYSSVTDIERDLDISWDTIFAADRAEVCEKYSTEDYQPVPHEYRTDDD